MKATTTQFSPESRGQYQAKAYSAASASSPLIPTTIPRRDPGDDDVQIKILFCGICHTDLHLVRNEWSGVRTVYPCVPGHEIVWLLSNQSNKTIAIQERLDSIMADSCIKSSLTIP
jgi:alcohol dehydrogenase (NADP+)